MIRKKICLLGAFSVGKTSLVRRFVHSLFSERYQTTVGVKIDKKLVQVQPPGGPAHEITLVLWDLHGEDAYQKVPESYLRGSSGYLIVADGTRPATFETALELDARMRGVCGEVPSFLLMNKVDLRSRWELDPAEVKRRTEGRWEPRLTSAKTGEGVERAFRDLAAAMASEAGS